jgi:hypothetical protein
MSPILGLSLFWTAALAALLGIVASARFTRLIVADTFPFSVRLRAWWDGRTRRGQEDESLWNPLLHCPWCFGPWVVIVNAGAGALSEFHPAWWIVNGLFAAFYATSWIVFHDED